MFQYITWYPIYSTSDTILLEPRPPFSAPLHTVWRCSRKFQMKSIINLSLQFPHRMHSTFALSHVLFIIVLCAAPFSLHFSVFLPHVLNSFLAGARFSCTFFYCYYLWLLFFFFWLDSAHLANKNVGNKFLVRINY